MSSFTVKTAQGDCPYIGVPAFLSRAFRHNSIYVRRDRIKSPEDLKSRRVGLPEYQLTACVWARIILKDEHGVMPSDPTWVRGGIEHPGRPEKIAIKLPPGVRMEDAPADTTISELQLRAAREFMGNDFWSYGLAANRNVLEAFLRHHHAEGLSPRLLAPEELFHPSTHESFAI
jgi:4,5-dihydroxyphthalate decarboxylase